MLKRNKVLGQVDHLVSNIVVENVNLFEEISRVAFDSILFGADIALDDDFSCFVVLFLYVKNIKGYLKGSGFAIGEDSDIHRSVEVKILVEHEL